MGLLITTTSSHFFSLIESKDPLAQPQSYPEEMAYTAHASPPPFSQTHLNTKISLQNYRLLLGLPYPSPAPRTSTRPSLTLPAWFPRPSRRGHPAPQDEHAPLLHNDEESQGVPSEPRTPPPFEHQQQVEVEEGEAGPRHTYTRPTGLYASLLRAESRATLLLTLHTILLSLGPLSQVLFSALIILLAASSPSTHSISIPLLAALNAVLAGALAMLGKGEGKGRREGRAYREGLRAVRERVEWVERELEAGLRDVVYGEVVGIREEYEGVRRERGAGRGGEGNGSGAE